MSREVEPSLDTALKERFLERLRDTGSARTASAEVGIDYDVVKAEYHRDRWFARAWSDVRSSRQLTRNARAFFAQEVVDRGQLLSKVVDCIQRLDPSRREDRDELLNWAKVLLKRGGLLDGGSTTHVHHEVAPSPQLPRGTKEIELECRRIDEEIRRLLADRGEVDAARDTDFELGSPRNGTGEG